MVLELEDLYTNIDIEGEDDVVTAFDDGSNLWKSSAKNCLVTRIQLQIKHVPIETHCLFCNNAAETTYHLILGCPFSKSCWNRSAVTLPPSTCTSFLTGLLLRGLDKKGKPLKKY
ncbi:hypothetical protein G4B88_000570 [Cannabis sativa]|uniref:Reverse transcriptase zinc-binding domain-containing protein n=1 Tax=Cannabis sativa TaxID=3483 RepID=A0A7J6ETE1_CANSA|nr:hypothetical protein G4B88_000570 [Cannabis sativa]